MRLSLLLMFDSWRLWRASVTQLLENWIQWIPCGQGPFLMNLHVDRMSTLSSVSIWAHGGSPVWPGCLRRGEPGQGLKTAAQSLHAEQQWDSILEWNWWGSLTKMVGPESFIYDYNFLCSRLGFHTFGVPAPVAQSVSAPYLQAVNGARYAEVVSSNLTWSTFWFSKKIPRLQCHSTLYQTCQDGRVV